MHYQRREARCRQRRWRAHVAALEGGLTPGHQPEGVAHTQQELVARWLVTSTHGKAVPLAIVAQRIEEAVLKVEVASLRLGL
eukprot:5360011-Prymnesium_polylepis.1